MKRQPLMAFMAFFILSCQTSPHLYEEFVRYNFTSEGFLTPEMLQTIGRSSYPAASTLDGAKALCAASAFKQARRRMLSIFLHTALEIQSNPGPRTTTVNFNVDYPAQFQTAEYMLAETVFEPVLARSYIALQDLRDTEACMVIARLAGTNLAGEIRSYRKDIESIKLPARNQWQKESAP